MSNLAQTSSGYLAPVSNAGDTLSGSITLAVGSDAAQTITLNSSNNTLSGLAAAINSSGVGITASVLTDSSGSRLSLVSGTSGAQGNIAVTANSIADTSHTTASALAYTAPVAGKDANLTVNGVALSSSSNTVNNLIPGVTFQLLAPSASGEQVQVIIGNDNTAVESTVNQFVTDFNSLVSAMNTQQGNSSSGTPEPLFGSPTLSLLQQQLLSGVNLANPNGSLTSIPASSNATLSGSITIQVGSGTAQTVTLGSSDNTLAGLAGAINAAGIGVNATVVTSNGESTLSLTSQTAGSAGALTVSSSIVSSTPAPLKYSDAGYTGATADTGTLGSAKGASDTLTGAVTIGVGSGTAQTFTLDSSDNTLAGLAGAINTANFGVTATVVTNSDGTSSLSLASGTVGAAGALAVTSTIADSTSPATTALNYTNSSDINSLTSLGISVNNDGTLKLDATSLDSVLNADYSSVVGFFQNAGGWGQTFSSTLTHSGTSRRDRGSGAGLEFEQRDRIDAERRHIKGAVADLGAAGEPDQRAEQRQRDHAAASVAAAGRQ